nr:hypothetical protein [Tanacetum cinerariifolium]
MATLALAAVIVGLVKSFIRVFERLDEIFVRTPCYALPETEDKQSLGYARGKKIQITKLLDNDGNPLVPTGIVESDNEVEVVFDKTANLRILTSGKDESDKGYGTNSLLAQWRDSYPDNDDYDPYDDDMYENHDLSEHLQSICDDLDITIYGRKKK